MRKAYVKKVKGGFCVKGHETDVARMLVACLLTLEESGWNIERLMLDIIEQHRKRKEMKT